MQTHANAIEKQPDDNSCLFHAIAYAVDPIATPAALRETVARTVRANPAEFNEAMLGKPVDEYCRFITNPIRSARTGPQGVFPCLTVASPDLWLAGRFVLGQAVVCAQ